MSVATSRPNRLNNAVDQLRKLIADDPENAKQRYLCDGVSKLAAIYSAADQQKKSIEILEELVRFWSNDAVAFNNLSYHLIVFTEPSGRDAQRALRLARRAVEIRPTTRNRWIQLARRRIMLANGTSQRNREMAGPSVGDDLFPCGAAGA